MKPTPQIIPAILAKTAREFKKKLDLMHGIAPLVQVDVMDGKLVPNTTWFDAETVASFDADVEYELHLMVKNPFPIVTDWMRVRGFTRMIVHAESRMDLKTAIRFAREKCIEIGVAISPGTPLSKIMPHVRSLDSVLVMGGTPGRSGKTLDPKTLDTVRTLRRRFPTLPIGFDIGVNAATIPALRRAGVTRFCAASAVYGAKNPRRALASLRRAL
ncbi:hypothetical protein A3E39_02825 [Candidatus Uhrbacteria bacterium RIFCSPHIGHO2_12_FULL_60_25]|uniref:Ribulose-phosphate 3-epimerase n=1 Tax=Candidatus Uhrbacteria bacterium RIFCSPHIGHO2_12_FULL_60_25 TaxID=1802399 RepID=A0A1F7UL32_9BACT|nr:MAG: hypothetical protein A3D73_00090 [Candidatus Uhrbacteria bacterium RIFCSPHIGHO2_02_FULL_60_44]OGL78408.1 MAG: hypothetical protein A3E39_02825 [Candidatus Uhrbacteria bacterium RIFCSPHIGHO2_12_FULL_60_25]